MPDRFGDDPDIARILDYRTIDACDLCDNHGNRGMHLCDHVDHASAAARGMAMIRAAMSWTK